MTISPPYGGRGHKEAAAMRYALRVAMLLALFALAGCSTRSEVEKLQVQPDDMKAARDADRATFETKIAAQAATIAERDAAITRLTEENITQGKRLENLATTYEGLKKSLDFLVSERQMWLKQRDEAVAKFDQFTKMYGELVERYRVDQANLANLKEDLVAKEKVIAELQGIITSHSDVRIPEKDPNPPAPALQGKINAVDNEAKVAEIDIGSDAGVVEAMKFIVYRDPGTRYLATLTVKKVGAKSAAGDLSVIRAAVQAGDKVTNKQAD